MLLNLMFTIGPFYFYYEAFDLCFAVTPLDELWAISTSGSLLQRLTKTFSHSHNQQKNDTSVLLHPDDFEDEWEVI